MHVLRNGAGVAGILIALLAVAPLSLSAQGLQDVPHGQVRWIHDHDWSGHFCRYPGPKDQSKSATTAQALAQVTIVQEAEPNDEFYNAQPLTLGPEPMAPVYVDVKGTVFNGADVDLYRVSVEKGDILGLACISHGALDPVLAVQQLSGVSLIENDNDGGLAYLYPPSSPMPGGVGLYDSALTWVAPVQGDYLIRVNSFASASRGDYTLQIRACRPPAENEDLNATQIIFLDFDGATLNAAKTFSISYLRSAAILSPTRDFLAGWGLTPEDESDVVEAVVNVVQDRFDMLRLASLNGNLPTDKIAGHYDVQILNSRDHADPWGQPNVSRVIIGGTIDQLGEDTIGLAESVDPGNFAREETAVVLLDALSSPLDEEWSINLLPRGSNMTIIEAIGTVVGNAVVHEAGHCLGNWHTDPLSEIESIMDSGTYGVAKLAGAGPDGILGTYDDALLGFNVDVYDPETTFFEGEQTTDVNTAFALASGRVNREAPPELPEWPYPLPAVRATPTSGSPPLRVEFFAGGIDYDPKDLQFTWDFADGTPTASGPMVAHVFEIPGQFLVKVTASNNQGVQGQASIPITVSATLPTAQVVATPARGPAPLTVALDASSSTASAGTIVKYEWDLGDGSTASGPTVQHEYSAPGYYAAKLTVTDSYGGTSSASVIISVNAPPAQSDNAYTAPSNTTTAPQCGLGSGVLMMGSLIGLMTMLTIRRRYY